MTKNNKKLVQAWITQEQFDKLAKLAKDSKRSKTSLAEEALERFISYGRVILVDDPLKNLTKEYLGALKNRCGKSWITTDQAADDGDYTVYRKGNEIIARTKLNSEIS